MIEKDLSETSYTQQQNYIYSIYSYTLRSYTQVETKVFLGSSICSFFFKTSSVSHSQSKCGNEERHPGDDTERNGTRSLVASLHGHRHGHGWQCLLPLRKDWRPALHPRITGPRPHIGEGNVLTQGGREPSSPLGHSSGPCLRKALFTWRETNREKKQPNTCFFNNTYRSGGRTEGVHNSNA